MKFLVFILIRVEGMNSFQQRKQLSEYFTMTSKLLLLLQAICLMAPRCSFLCCSFLEVSWLVSLTFPFLIKNHVYALKGIMFYYSVRHMQACMCVYVFSIWLVHISFIIILFFVCLVSF